MAFSDYLERAVLDHIVGTSALVSPTTVYVALSSTAPNDDGSGVTEPTFTGYARQPATFTAASQSGTGPAEITNDAVIEYGDPDQDGSASHFAIYDAQTAGNLLVHAALDATAQWQAAVTDPVSFAVGALAITLD